VGRAPGVYGSWPAERRPGLSLRASRPLVPADPLFLSPAIDPLFFSPNLLAVSLSHNRTALTPSHNRPAVFLVQSTCCFSLPTNPLFLPIDPLFLSQSTRCFSVPINPPLFSFSPNRPAVSLPPNRLAVSLSPNRPVVSPTPPPCVGFGVGCPRLPLPFSFVLITDAVHNRLLSSAHPPHARSPCPNSPLVRPAALTAVVAAGSGGEALGDAHGGHSGRPARHPHLPAPGTPPPTCSSTARPPAPGPLQRRCGPLHSGNCAPPAGGLQTGWPLASWRRRLGLSCYAGRGWRAGRSCTHRTSARSPLLLTARAAAAWPGAPTPQSTGWAGP
jgi:hypothetical protein